MALLVSCLDKSTAKARPLAATCEQQDVCPLPVLANCVSRCLPTRGDILLAIEAREDVKLARTEVLEKKIL